MFEFQASQFLSEANETQTLLCGDTNNQVMHVIK